MTLTTAKLRGRISFGESLLAGTAAWAGNFIGALFVAYVIAFSSGLIFESAGGTLPWAKSIVNLTNAKCSLDWTTAFIRGVGCNWLVCLAVFAAAASTEVIGKIVALWFPTMAFVALGMEHCIANMFFVPLGIFTGTDPRYLALTNAGEAQELIVGWSEFFIDNLVPVTLGNIVGGAALVGMLYILANYQSKS